MFTFRTLRESACNKLSRTDFFQVGLLVALALFTILTARAEDCPSDICISMPKTGEAVAERPIVDVIVKDSNADVWVIVHPMEVADYWVQPRLTNRGEGNWRGSIYVGRPGSTDIGKHFEIMAIANPTSKLARGDILSEFPDAMYRSDIIEVIRR